ncbi:Actin cytoskeleton-regulatory complex protein pan1 [Aspergillus clavatus NRRL 1] [Rhizoctonia solani]|uniref:Actin cytoskeleton-regulatory complex protein pan1 [Aspergillus clavatus NRRL 1] n=1 Tax=Rhizoctonia solani TaxID=456999 RepID=A0A0K6G4I7_9AGAM|nr:Actin cytoskeleton-regulatory complex protein pan1 [Aspergillus clavatus NRRL 1] [Rhizoctonia solani]
MDTMSPPRSLSELEDVSDTSSIGSGDWTDLSSAHADDVSDDGRPISVPGRMNDGSEEAWTTAEGMSSSSASVYASVHAPLNPFESDGESERSVRPGDVFQSPRRELELILPDPLERSDSTLNVDLSFSDAVLATNPTAVVSIAGAYPSIAQRSAVVKDVLRAISVAARASVVRAEYYHFGSLSELPSRVENPLAPEKEIVVLVRDHTVAPLTHSVDGTPSILVVFTSDAHESTVPSIHKHSILIPVVLSESRPVVLFDENDRPDETSVDITELTRQLSNLFTFERDSVATTQTAVDVAKELELDDKPFDSDVRTQDLDLDNQSLESFDTDDISDRRPLDNTSIPELDEKPKPVVRKRQPLDRLVGEERAELFRRLNASMGPGLTAACALAVVLSLVLGTGHLIQSSRQGPTPAKATTLAPTSVATPSSTIHALDPISIAETSLALKSPHTSLAAKSSTGTSLAVKSQHTSLSVRSSSTTALSVKTQHTNLSVRVPVNESCSTMPVSVSKAETTSLSTIPIASTSLSTATAASSSTATSSASSSSTAKAHVIHEVVEELSMTVERVLGLNLRTTIRKSDAAILEAVNRANEAIKAASGIDTAEHVKQASSELRGRHAIARRTAQRQFANLKRGMESLWGDEKEDVKGKGKATCNAKGKGKEKEETHRPGRDKWHTSKDTGKSFRSDRIVKKDKLKDEKSRGCGKCSEKKIKSKFPTREEAEHAAKAGARHKRPTTEVEVEWAWDADVEYEYPFGYGPRTVLQEVQEYFVF